MQSPVRLLTLVRAAEELSKLYAQKPTCVLAHGNRLPIEGVPPAEPLPLVAAIDALVEVIRQECPGIYENYPIRLGVGSLARNTLDQFPLSSQGCWLTDIQRTEDYWQCIMFVASAMSFIISMCRGFRQWAEVLGKAMEKAALPEGRAVLLMGPNLNPDQKPQPAVDNAFGLSLPRRQGSYPGETMVVKRAKERPVQSDDSKVVSLRERLDRLKEETGPELLWDAFSGPGVHLAGKYDEEQGE